MQRDDLNQLTHLLSILYSPTGPSTTPQLQQEAQRTLFKAQQSPEAWQWPSILLSESVNYLVPIHASFCNK